RGLWTMESCNEPQLRLRVGDHTVPALQTSYSSEEFPFGATPMSKAIRGVRLHQWLIDPADPHDGLRDKAVLLVTDGTPSANCDNDNADSVVAEILQLGVQRIRTFVVGFGANDYLVDPIALDRFALAGGTNNPGDPLHGYYQASNAIELAAALQQISTQLITCTQILAGAPAAPDRIYVMLDNQPLLRDDPNGFHYDPISNTITLDGGSCGQLKTSRTTNLVIVFGCPPAGGPPIIR
ncbi:MAG: hypothetical protein MJD61_13955, partial [Proteobacteria bacterium]|nr:hypothetical protein [Pseudomonadota bacterium]